MQIRAGTGGDEAALFASDLLRMYQRYAEEQSWKISFLSESASENGGLKEAIVQVRPRITFFCRQRCLPIHCEAALCRDLLPLCSCTAQTIRHRCPALQAIIYSAESIVLAWHVSLSQNVHTDINC